MKTFLKLGLAALASLSIFTGCAADEDPSGSSDSDIVARGKPEPELRGEGEACGFDGSRCAEGLECRLPTNFVGVPDVAICQPKSSGTCSSLGPACPPTFICVTDADGNGHCEGTALGGD